jgi:hypothetical protein
LRHDRFYRRTDLWRHFLAWEHEARRATTLHVEFEPEVEYFHDGEDGLPLNYDCDTDLFDFHDGGEDEDDDTTVVVKQEPRTSSSSSEDDVFGLPPPA